MGDFFDYASGQPFVFNAPQSGQYNLFDENRNAAELGLSTPLYVVEGFPVTGPISVDVRSKDISPNAIVSILDNFRKLLPIWVWALIGFALLYFKNNNK